MHEIRVTRVTERRMAQLFFDITERKRAERRQAELFDELNHRVNNNLSLVSGILRMKARETDSDAVRDQLLRPIPACRASPRCTGRSIAAPGTMSWTSGPTCGNCAPA